MLYASTQPEGELLSDRYGTWITQHIYMYDQTTSVELSHILQVVQKSVEFSGVGSLMTHPLGHYKHVLTAPARYSQYKISHVHDDLRDYIIADVGGL